MDKIFLKKIIFLFLGSIIYVLFPLFISLRKNSIYVINYHATYPDNNNNFIKQILFFKKYFNLVDEKHFFELKKLRYNKPKLLITFDDGHISNIGAINILKKYKIPATVFIPYDCVNRKRAKNIKAENYITNKKFNIISDLHKDLNYKYKSLSMNFNDLKKIKKKNFSIGVHGYNHIRLSESLSEKKLRKEIIMSKKKLENKLKIKINSFCWTFGDKDSYSKKAAKLIKNNYKLSFMTCCKPYSLDQNLLQIHRFNIENFFSLSQVAFVLSGIYEIIYLYKRKFVNNLTK